MLQTIVYGSSAIKVLDLCFILCYSHDIDIYFKILSGIKDTRHLSGDKFSINVKKPGHMLSKAHKMKVNLAC